MVVTLCNLLPSMFRRCMWFRVKCHTFAAFREKNLEGLVNGLLYGKCSTLIEGVLKCLLGDAADRPLPQSFTARVFCWSAWKTLGEYTQLGKPVALQLTRPNSFLNSLWVPRPKRFESLARRFSKGITIVAFSQMRLYCSVIIGDQIYVKKISSDRKTWAGIICRSTMTKANFTLEGLLAKMILFP